MPIDVAILAVAAAHKTALEASAASVAAYKAGAVVERVRRTKKGNGNESDDGLGPARDNNYLDQRFAPAGYGSYAPGAAGDEKVSAAAEAMAHKNRKDKKKLRGGRSSSSSSSSSSSRRHHSSGSSSRNRDRDGGGRKAAAAPAAETPRRRRTTAEQWQQQRGAIGSSSSSSGQSLGEREAADAAEDDRAAAAAAAMTAARGSSSSSSSAPGGAAAGGAASDAAPTANAYPTNEDGTTLLRQPTAFAPAPSVLISVPVTGLHRRSGGGGSTGGGHGRFKLKHPGPLMAAISGSWSKWELVVYDFGQRRLLQTPVGTRFSCGHCHEPAAAFEPALPEDFVEMQALVNDGLSGRAWRLQFKSAPDAERFIRAAALARAHATVFRLPPAGRGASSRVVLGDLPPPRGAPLSSSLPLLSPGDVAGVRCTVWRVARSLDAAPDACCCAAGDGAAGAAGGSDGGAGGSAAVLYSNHAEGQKLLRVQVGDGGWDYDGGGDETDGCLVRGVEGALDGMRGGGRRFFLVADPLFPGDDESSAAGPAAKLMGAASGPVWAVVQVDVRKCRTRIRPAAPPPPQQPAADGRQNDDDDDDDGGEEVEEEEEQEEEGEEGRQRRARSPTGRSSSRSSRRHASNGGKVAGGGGGGGTAAAEESDEHLVAAARRYTEKRQKLTDTKKRAGEAERYEVRPRCHRCQIDERAALIGGRRFCCYIACCFV